MTQDPKAQVLTQDKTQAASQTVLPAKQEETGQAVESFQVHWPEWPTSKPGPCTTPSPVGSKAINAIRREQVTPVIYDQETGESLQPEEQKTTGEQMLGKRKQRL